MSNINPVQLNYKVPISRLFYGSIVGGIIVYLGLWVLDRPSWGILLGFLTWLLLNNIAYKTSNKRVIRQAEDLFAQRRDDEALEFLKYVCERYKGFKEVREYYEDKLNISGEELIQKTSVFTEKMTQTISETAPSPLNPVEEISTTGEGPVKLSLKATMMLVLLPLVFIPFWRHTPPNLGLWAVGIIIILGISNLKNLKGRWELKVTGLCLSLALISLILFGISFLANGITGMEPEFSMELDSSQSSFLVKVFGFIVLMFSVVFHEIAHAYAAFFSGDPTAKNQGRTRLNPLRHIDLFGTVILPLLMFFLPGGVVFGWAKPVECNPDNYRNYRRGQLAVSFAGVATNLLLATFSCSMLITIGIFLHRCYPGMTAVGFANPWKEVTLTGIPAAGLWVIIIEFFKAGIFINMILFSLNIIPVPPLDGFGIIEGIFFKTVRIWLQKARQWGSLIFLGLIFTNILDYLLIPGILAAWIMNSFAGKIVKLG